MPIKRAGPWGNITNSFQNVPGNTGADGLTLYPVNCAKTNWVSGQAWGAYYEVVDGCCTPDTLDFDHQVVGFYATNLSGTLERDPAPWSHPPYSWSDLCEAYTWTDGTYSAHLYWEETVVGGAWWFEVYIYDTVSLFYGVNEDTTDRCDPVATYYQFWWLGGGNGSQRAIVTLPAP